MFYELIYTRCKNGVDVLRNGSPMTNEGYKVYSCSPEIYQREGLVDLNLLIDAAQAQQSYRDSQSDKFMDEAYLYYAPDFGEKFLINFHPVPFDPSRQGDYTKKPGNFLNQILIGNFSKFYAWQFFDDAEVWNAKQHDEPFYYASTPQPMKPREIVPSGKYNFDAIKKFVSNGRKELLKKAVAFLMSQYSLDAPDRKYLLIQDSSTENIELWIAAIECAFSPRISAGIPFATRLDKYASVNPYTVKSGKFQSMVNYQDPEQSLRYRAMIVGVNINDEANNDPVRVLDASQFVLLDGVEMTASFEPEIDTRSEYFNLITRFDDAQKTFCMNLLQHMNINAPVADLPEIYDAFVAFKNVPALTISELIRHIKTISRYQFVDVKPIRDVYNSVKINIDGILSKDFASSLDVIKWIKATAPKTGDSSADEFLIARVINFANNAAKNFTDSDDAVNFYGLYLKALAILGKRISRDDVMPVISSCVNMCATSKDLDGMRNLFAMSDDVDLMLDAGADCPKFTVDSIIEIKPEILSSFDKVRSFCDVLNSKGMSAEAPDVISKSIRVIKSNDEVAKFAQWLSECDYVSSDDVARMFIALDNKVAYGASLNLPGAIIKYRPEGAKCSRTANVLGVYLMKKAVSERLDNFVQRFQRLEDQGFPSMSDSQKFIDDFGRAFIEIRYTKEDPNARENRDYMFGLLFKEETPREFLVSVVRELIANAEEYTVKWNFLLGYACEYPEARDMTFDAVVDEILSSSNIKKQLKRLGSLTSRKNPRASLFFAEIEDEVESRMEPGFFEKVFSAFKGKKQGRHDDEEFE